MGFLTPTALALAALALPIIIFYMLKLRRQPARVSSLLLWQQVMQDRQANAPWQRLKRNLLLLLQLVILALLVMALARPFFIVQASVQGNVVLLLDASASMQATDVAPTRFAAARAAALDLIDRLQPGDAVTLIAVESQPRVLAATTTDRAALRRTLAAAQPANSPADWNAALTLAAANAATLPDATIVLISDGNLSPEHPNLPSPQPSTLLTTQPFGNLTTLPAPTQFIPIGHSANNQGLVALSLRDGVDGPELFLRVFNAAPDPARRLVEIYVDDQLFDVRRLNLPARDSASLTLTGLPLNAQQVRASLAGPPDALPADDTAWVARNPAPARVLLVGDGNLFLERALALLPGVNPQRAAPGQTLPQAQFDLIIFDRVLPPAAALPESNLLFIAPPASTSLFEVSGVITQTQLTRLETRHPLLAYVKLNNLHVAQAQAVNPPAWMQTLVEAKGGPLLLAGQTGSRRVAMLTFDLRQSDLPLQIDFPVLVVNLARWLLPGAETGLAQAQTLPAGQPFDLPAVSSAGRLIVQTPSGEKVAMPPEADRFSQTFDLGLYRILAQEPDQSQPALLTQFAVNLLSEAETDIQPRQPDLAGSTPAAAEKNLTGRREWWPFLVLAGLVALLLEWWVYWRGEVR